MIIKTDNEELFDVKAESWIKALNIYRDIKTKIPAEAIIFKAGTLITLLYIPIGRKVSGLKLGKCDIIGQYAKRVSGVPQEMEGDSYQILIESNLASDELKYTAIDILEAENGDTCPNCKSATDSLQLKRAIEVGHTFFLGTKYSSPLDATFVSRTNANIPFEMGCYGLGVSRIMAAVVEVANDKDGIKWPIALAPYRACFISSISSEQDEYEITEKLKELPWFQEDEMVIDDRGFQFGYKMKDALLIGYPYIIVARDLYHKTGCVEIHDRRNSLVTSLKIK